MITVESFSSSKRKYINFNNLFFENNFRSFVSIISRSLSLQKQMSNRSLVWHGVNLLLVLFVVICILHLKELSLQSGKLFVNSKTGTAPFGLLDWPCLELTMSNETEQQGLFPDENYIFIKILFIWNFIIVIRSYIEN